MFTGIYAPCENNTEEVNLFWREIEETGCFWNYPWVIGGDFNDIRYAHEISLGEASTNGIRKFNNFISRHHLFDLPLIGTPYTWTNNQVQSVRSRIDRYFLCPALESAFPQATQHVLSRPCSNHNPIALVCGGVKFGPSPFRSSKIQLRIWSIRELGEVDSKLEELEDVFTELDAIEHANNGLLTSQWEERAAARKEYCNLSIIKDEKWRSRAIHFKYFEKNTKYFHRLANDRRRRSYIGAIKVDGVLTYDVNEIKDDIVAFFQDIFQSQQQRIVTADNMQFNQITQEMRVWLERDT
ncbi:uncharacterized protein LOC113305890 [Papaver somniferum]|uniref:uncharacterized protein LOC113305890 n=1 Tax=Papaver somniferum TaxID=3469 RepID=UPI000E6FBF8A|nr:uncharacterized protein LOC113305890 [Papaver somniferum]